MKLSIVIPLFNEKDNIGLLIRDIYEKLNEIEFEITVVDDNSYDGTIEVLKNLESEYKNFFWSCDGTSWRLGRNFN